jgi:hypothetical protein
MEPHERLHISLTLKKVKTIFLCIGKNTFSSLVQPISMKTITPPETTHFHGNHHTAGNNPRRPHNSEPDPPEIQTVSDWTTTPTTLLVGEGPDPGQPVRIRPDPIHPGRSRPGSNCFGRRTGSPVRPDPAMARGFDPFFSGHMMKGIFVFV